MNGRETITVESLQKRVEELEAQNADLELRIVALMAMRDELERELEKARKAK